MSIVPKNPYELVTEEMREALRDAWPDGERLIWAWRLALDVDTCGDLIAGRPIDPSRINRDVLADAKRRQLVQLVAPLELFDREAA